MPGRVLATWLIGLGSLIVPSPHRRRWRREWEAELFHRERQLSKSGAGSLRVLAGLVGPALGALVHSGWLRGQDIRFDELRQDARFAVRSYARAPAFSIAAVLTLGLGIAGNVMVLAIVEGALLRPYPYRDADDIALLVGRHADRPGIDAPLAFPDVEALSRAGVFESVATVEWDPFNVRFDDRTEWVGGGLVTSTVFETFGVQPIRGRTLQAEDDDPGGAPVVVLGELLWRSAFGADDVVGEVVWLDGIPHEVVGVVPAHMDVPAGAELWVPLRPEGSRLTRESQWAEAYGRIAPGVSWDRARAALELLGATIATSFPETNEGLTFKPIPLREARTAEFRPAMLSLLAAVGVLLLIVCANLGNLVLARTVRREPELGVRLTLGAGPGRLVRQLVTENLVLASAGATVGVVLGVWGLRALEALMPTPPVWFDPTVDVVVIGATVVTAVVCSVLFGVAPALRRAGAALRGTVRSPALTAGRPRQTLVFVEVVLSTVLLVSAGLLIRSLSELTRVDPGFEAEGRLVGTLQLPESRYGDDERLIAFADQLLRSTVERPEIGSAGIVTRMPFQSGANHTRWWIRTQGEDAFQANPRAELNSISPGYLVAMGVSLIRGRSFDASDDDDADGVVIINQTFAYEVFGEQNPIGERISITSRPRFREIVGVVGDTKQLGLDQPDSYQIYVPYPQRPTARMTVLLEGPSPGAMAAPLRDVVREIDPDLAISDLAQLEHMVQASVWRLRILTSVFWGFGIFAVLLSAVGVAGVVAQSVAHRTREIGVRVALGAGWWQIVGLICRGVAGVVAAGLTAGVMAALLLGRLAQGLLYGVEPSDPSTLAAVVVGFAIVAAIATVAPARKALSIDPADALRSA